MRNEFISLFAALNATELESLIGETRETITADAPVQNKKPVFTAANLWSIHNMKRTRTSRRFM
ncbi:hypothetical protein [Parafilimonas sp.]|uniref:hypothetical protein n=1 Tax=Parafilimonas sp. TaxID=1969739 RepID=UPI0039E295A5